MDGLASPLCRRKRSKQSKTASSSGFVGGNVPAAAGKGLSCFLQTVKNTPCFKHDRAGEEKQDGGRRNRVRGSQIKRKSRRGSVLPAVAWPGMELDASDIEGYSDTSSHSSPGRETVVSSHQPSSSLSKYISGVWHNPAGGPPEVETITDYNSSPSPGSPQTPSLLHHKQHRHSSHITSPHPLIEDDISSGSSSPEPSTTSSPLLKASDWLKQSIQETPSTAVDTSVSESVLLSSGPKGKRRRGMRFVAGGMAEQLQRVIQRETADVAFWEHQVKRREDKEVTDPCVIVEVLTVSSLCSLLLACCRVQEGQQLLSDQYSTQQQDVEVMVYFDISTARQLRLTVGCIVRIHSPWQKLLLTDDTAPPLPVLLCTHYSELIGHTSSSPAILLSPSPVNRKFVSHQFSDTILSPTSAMLSRSPVKLMQPSRLFASSSPKQSLTTPSQKGVLEALEQCQRGSMSFTATVRAIYRRPSPSSLSSSIRSRQCSENAMCCWWVVLLQDDHGICAELMIRDDHLSIWDDIIRSGEGKRLDIIGLRVVRRTTASRDPELFSLIHSLFWSPDDTSTFDTTSAAAQYSFCYVCYTQQNSSYEICSTEHTSHTDYTPASTSSRCATNETSPLTLSLSGRVLFLYPNPEHHQDTISSSVDGYTLLLAVSVAIGSNDSNSASQVVSVHIKPSFPIAGLLRVLSSPGEMVTLKNVSPTNLNDSKPSYTMGAYSLLIPLSHAHLNGVWPCSLHSLADKRRLSQLSPPVCPWFDPASEAGCLVHVEGAIVSIDQSTAYSWLECDVCGQSDLVSMNMSQCYTCGSCQRTVHSPTTRVQLAVILSSTHYPAWEYHVHLGQTTVLNLLPETAGSFDEGFDINCVLQRQLSLPVCFLTKKAVNPHGCSTVFLIEVDTRWSCCE